eukprot:GEMP01008899.1.p1 GENE.GEMP01008899.1~~GEMP01008899.1.p1  ORF type:complete len:709 (+),score=151.67 GEMP01008899.1:60-2129(+)
MDCARHPRVQREYSANGHEWELFSDRREKSASCAQIRGEDTALPSTGSAFHQAGDCRRCCFYPKGRCSSGTSCQFCHFDHDKRKRLKKRSGVLLSARRTCPADVEASQKPTWVVIDLSQACIEPRKGNKGDDAGHRRFDDILEDFSKYARCKRVVPPTSFDETTTQMAQIPAAKLLPSSPLSSNIAGPRSESAEFCPTVFWEKNDGITLTTHGHVKARDYRKGTNQRADKREEIHLHPRASSELARSSSSSYTVCGKSIEDNAHAPLSLLEHQRRYATAEAWRTYSEQHYRNPYSHYDPYYRYAMMAQHAYNYHNCYLGYNTTWSCVNSAAARDNMMYYPQRGSSRVGGVVGAHWRDTSTDLLDIERARRFSDEEDAHIVRTSDTSVEPARGRASTTAAGVVDACSDSHKHIGVEDRFYAKPNSSHTADTTVSIGGKTEDKAAAQLDTYWDGASVCSSSSIDEIVFLDGAMFRPCASAGAPITNTGHTREVPRAAATTHTTTSVRTSGSANGAATAHTTSSASTDDTGALVDDIGAPLNYVDTKSDSFWRARSPEDHGAPSTPAHRHTGIDDGWEAGAYADYVWRAQRRQREHDEQQQHGSWNRARGGVLMKNSEANDSEKTRCPNLPSIGSAKHFWGDCRRCCFFPKEAQAPKEEKRGVLLPRRAGVQGETDLRHGGFVLRKNKTRWQ